MPCCIISGFARSFVGLFHEFFKTILFLSSSVTFDTYHLWQSIEGRHGYERGCIKRQIQLFSMRNFGGTHCIYITCIYIPIVSGMDSQP